MAEKAIDSKLPGALSQYYLDSSNRDLFLDYLKAVSPKTYSDYLWSLLGDRDFLMALDVLEGTTIKIPSRQNLTRIMQNISIYSYLKARDCSQDAFEKAALIFKKRETILRSIYENVEKALAGDITEEDLEEGEEDA